MESIIAFMVLGALLGIVLKIVDRVQTLIDRVA